MLLFKVLNCSSLMLCCSCGIPNCVTLVCCVLIFRLFLFCLVHMCVVIFGCIGTFILPNIFVPRVQDRPNIAEAAAGLHEGFVHQNSTAIPRNIFEANHPSDRSDRDSGTTSALPGLSQQSPPDMLSTLVLVNNSRSNTDEDWDIIRRCAAALGIQMSECVQPFPRAQFLYLKGIFTRVQMFSVPLLRTLYDNPVAPGIGREHSLNMSARRFEIECSTIGWQFCDTCGMCAATAGVFMNDGGGPFRPFWQNCTHFIYSDGTDKLKWGDPRNDPNSVSVYTHSCSGCRKDVQKHDTNPKFSVEAGFNHGVPIPTELSCLTYAEEALIARIQPVMACKVLKYGQRAMKGMSVFVDRMGSIVEVANVLPRLAKDVQAVILERQRGSMAPHKMVELVCRRAQVEAVRQRCAITCMAIKLSVSTSICMNFLLLIYILL